MGAALEVDAKARATPEAWMLNRFLVPASQLGAVPEDFEPPLGVIVDTDELPELSGRRVVTVEGRLERADVIRAERWRAPSARQVSTPRVFLEVWPGNGAKLREVADRGAGAKVRCGGPTPDMFPSPAELAAFITGCRELGLPFKATAGLHHPIRDGIVHGFLNLLAAAVLAHAGGGERELIAVLLEEEASAFGVTEEAFTAGGHRFGVEQVVAARAELFVGYGSCSFSEPVEDLRALGFL